MAKVCKKFDDVCEIVPTQEYVRIQVRVLRLWKVPVFLIPGETSSIEMVLVDEKGGKIHASIRKQLLYMFESKIEEGEVYQMSYFSVVPQIGVYRTTLHPSKLIFQMKTKVHHVETSDISQYGLTLTSLAEVCRHSHDYEFLVDVMGLVTGISPEREYVRDGKLTKMVVVQLTDASGKLDCALFGDYVYELNKKMGKAGEGLPVLVIQFAKVKIFRDQASIQNVINTTRIFVNPDLPEALRFKESVAVHGIELDSKVPVISGGGKPPVEEEFLRMHSKKSIAELNDLQEDGLFTIYGAVSGIVPDQEWWYPACKCHRSVVPDSGAYFCNGCAKHVFQIVPRFRVKIEISDGGSTCVFVLFDSDMSYILEKSCAHFVGKAKVPNDGSIPAEFHCLVGKKMLFVIEKGLKQTKIVDGTFRVKRVCFDSKIIKTYCAEGFCFTPVKPATPLIDIVSDGEVDEVDSVIDSHAIGFMKDIIVTPPIPPKSNLKEDVVLNNVKRNLNEAFDVVSKTDGRKSLRRVKLEKE
ncbi:replication protein A 70 kDa DNA-binding subunit B [Trifolium repens]|nr:replication protein A 70 kDa DNA-binding subunit B [Trifolium repens]